MHISPTIRRHENHPDTRYFSWQDIDGIRNAIRSAAPGQRTMMRAPGPSGVNAERFLLGSDLPEPPHPRLNETFGGV